MEKILFSPYKLGRITLKNRIVMAPMTRSRAIGNIPNDIMKEYYTLRASAGLIVTEGTSPSPNGLGYARIPGLFNQDHVYGWRKITDAVHKNEGKIFVQLMHTGRVSHPLNLPTNARIISSSAEVLDGEIWTDQKQLQPFPVPEEMTLDDIKTTIEEFVKAATLAIEAGFDGIELHAANGYLIEQFINPTVNKRTDQYGGSIENRIRFVTEIASKASDAIGSEKIGIRVSPYGISNGMKFYDEIEETYSLLSEKLNSLNLAYIHIVDHSSMGAPEVKPTVKTAIRQHFKNNVILSGGYNVERAEKDICDGKGDLVAFGKYFISNPNLVEKLKNGRPLVEADKNTFYSPGEKGYIDYPIN